MRELDNAGSRLTKDPGREGFLSTLFLGSVRGWQLVDEELPPHKMPPRDITILALDESGGWWTSDYYVRGQIGAKRFGEGGTVCERIRLEDRDPWHAYEPRPLYRSWPPDETDGRIDTAVILAMARIIETAQD